MKIILVIPMLLLFNISAASEQVPLSTPLTGVAILRSSSDAMILVETTCKKSSRPSHLQYPTIKILVDGKLFSPCTIKSSAFLNPIAFGSAFGGAYTVGHFLKILDETKLRDAIDSVIVHEGAADYVSGRITPVLKSKWFRRIGVVGAFATLYYGVDNPAQAATNQQNWLGSNKVVFDRTSNVGTIPENFDFSGSDNSTEIAK